MPAEFGQSSDEQESSTIREAPPHLEVNSTPRLTGHDIKESRDVEGPLENIPEDADTPASTQMTESPINTNTKSGGMRVEGRVTLPPKSTPTKRRYAVVM